jgi:beta-barrel assembly-enhancing protease
MSMWCLQACVTGTALEAERQRAGEAEKALAEKNWPKAQIALQSEIEGPGFRRMSQDDQYHALHQGAFVGLYHGDKDLGYSYLLRLTAMPKANVAAWQDLTNFAYTLKHPDDSARGLIELARRWPEEVPKLDERVVASALAAIHSQPREKHLTSLWALYQAQFKLKWGYEPSSAWRDLTLLLLESDRLTDAADVAGHITSSKMLMVIRSDRRFDAVVAARPDRFEVESAAHEELRFAQTLSDGNPQLLDLKVDVVISLQRLRDYGAMLAVADELKMEIASTNFPRRLYTDYDDKYRWLLYERAMALERMGRSDEAVKELQAASRLSEEGARNVSQSISLGALLCRLNRPGEALAAIADVGPVSEYGSAEIEVIRLQAALQLKDEPQAAKSLQSLQINRASQPEKYELGLVLAGQMDRAAQSLMARLRDPVKRQDAFELVQDFPPLPSAKFEQDTDELWRLLVARADVQSAIDKVGRAGRYHMELVD